MAEHATIQATPKNLPSLAEQNKTPPQSPEHCGPPKAASQVRVEWITNVKMIEYARRKQNLLRIDINQKEQ